MNIRDLRNRIDELSPRVASFVARGRKPRDLSQAERRLAVEAPAKFDALVQSLQAETLEDMRAEAAHTVLQEDLATAQDAERMEALAKMRTERAELLTLRYERATEIDAAMTDLEASLVEFQDLNAKINAFDRALDEGDRNKASFGLLAIALKRSIFQKAPSLWKAAGFTSPFVRNSGTDRGLAEMMVPEGYDWAERNHDPLEH